MWKSGVYFGNFFIGEAEIFPKNTNSSLMMREIRISHFSPSSDRCPPLAVLHAVVGAADGVCFKLESKSPEVFDLFSACLREKKTAVVNLSAEEVHLVAMPSRKNAMQYSCFWGFSIAPGLYNSCLDMLNLRRLGIVFDLDETLVVANTMRSFEDKINAVKQKISSEKDPQRVTAMLAEVKRYQDDRLILKQYLENDQVVDDGKVFKVQAEVVQPISESHQPSTRPIIRLQEKNIILTRVNPAIRDTSILVQLRPAWEHLSNYISANGRKRFEVYVCTLAERDYALEMWRLLDPEAKLISSKELLDRIVCVKPGTKKSLFSVFRDGICHPNIALIIDDRLNVWDEKDQPRVHVVPAYAPYYAPQAEANNTIPVLSVARNVTCNVRASFFIEFDQGLLPRIAGVFYEDELVELPCTPDVSNYLISEDDAPASNGSKGPPPSCREDTGLKSNSLQIATQTTMPSQSTLLSKPLGQSTLSESKLQCSITEEGEIPESDVDPNTRRRLLILQHGQDIQDPSPPLPPPQPLSFPFIPPPQVSGPPVQPPGSWLPFKEEMHPRQQYKAPAEFPLQPQIVHFDRNQYQHPFFSGVAPSFPSGRVLHENERPPTKVLYGDTRAWANQPVPRYNTHPGEQTRMGQISSNYHDIHLQPVPPSVKYTESPVAVLHDIAMKAKGGKVEFRTSLCDTRDLKFSVEVWLVGDKIGEGIGRTRKDAQHQAVMSSLQTLAKKYMLPDPTVVRGGVNNLSNFKENGFVSDSNSSGHPAFEREDGLMFASTSDSRKMNHTPEIPKCSVAALIELCTMEGYSLVFQDKPKAIGGSVKQEEIHAEVEIAGQILGKGIGKSWQEAKLQAAEEAHRSLKSMLGQFTQKRSGSPRSLPMTSNKRLKQDFLVGVAKNSIIW